MNPIISVITVCYNSEKTIKNTVESVYEQDLTDLEYLIIDGSSKDHTLEILDEYVDKFKGKMRIISEPDNGWYDAMNKGVCNSKGDFIVFLNSDDFFDKDAVKTVVKYIKENKIDSNYIVYGDSTNIYENSKNEVYYRKITAPEGLRKNDKRLKDGMCGIRHQSMFVGRQVYERVGLLDLRYRLHADWDFLVKCVNNDIQMKHIPKNLTFYSMYGVSSRPNYHERHQLRKNNGLYSIVDYKYIKDRWGIKVLIKRMLGEQRWNDLLFWIHKQRNDGYVEKRL